MVGANLRFEDLRCPLDSLDMGLKGRPTAASGSQPGSKPQPRFQSVHHPSKSALNATSRGGDSSATVGGLLNRLRAAETAWLAEKGRLQLELKAERQRAQRAETGLRRAEEQRDFRLGEVRHLKAALTRRDDVITGLQDEVRELEVGVSSADAVKRAEAERDELQAAVAGVQQQFHDTSLLLADVQTEAAGLRSKVQDVQDERNEAEDRAVRAERRCKELAALLRQAQDENRALAEDANVWDSRAVQTAEAMRQLLRLGNTLGGTESGGSECASPPPPPFLALSSVDSDEHSYM